MFSYCENLLFIFLLWIRSYSSNNLILIIFWLKMADVVSMMLIMILSLLLICFLLIVYIYQTNRWCNESIKNIAISLILKTISYNSMAAPKKKVIHSTNKTSKKNKEKYINSVDPSSPKNYLTTIDKPKLSSPFYREPKE